MDPEMISDAKTNGERELSLTTSKASNGSYIPSTHPVPRRSTRPGDEKPDQLIKSVMASLRRVWPVGLLLGLLVAPALAYAGWIFMPNKYTATAVLQLEMDQTPIAFTTADQKSDGGAGGFKVYKNTQKQLILSPKILSSALANEKMSSLGIFRNQEDSLSWLMSNLKVTFPDDGEVMTIALPSLSKEDSKTAVDSIVQVYMDEVVYKEKREKDSRLENLKKSQTEALRNVKDKRQEIRNRAEVLGTSDSDALTIAQQAAVQRYTHLQDEFSKVTYELLDAEDRLLQMQDQLKLQTEMLQGDGSKEGGATQSRLSELEMERAYASDQEYQRLAAEASELNRKIREMERGSFGARFTAPLQADIEKINTAMAERREKIIAMVESDFDLRRATGRPSTDKASTVNGTVVDPITIKMQETAISLLRKRKELIQTDLRKSEEETEKLSLSSVDLDVMQSELTSLEEVLATVTSELEATRIERMGKADRVTIISNAEIIDGNSKNRRLFASIGGGLFGLCLPLFALGLMDMLKKHLDDPQQIKDELNVDILGMLPTKNAPIRILEPPTTGRGKRRYAHFVESVHSIVAMLIKKASVDDRQIFMVTSPGPSEGKSTLSQNLWAGLCEANYRCILIDMDLRRPSVHRYLNIEIGVGVSDVLSGKSDIDSAIRTFEGRGDVMTAGDSRQLNIAALAGAAIPNLFDQLRAKYDFIIVDSAPLLPVVDSRIIGEHVDGAVLTTIRDRTRLPQMIAAIELLRAHGTDILGVVVSGYEGGSYGYSYRYGYGYGYGSPYGTY
jgi:succinoglycan biosynthesis transport protein ExoP